VNVAARLCDIARAGEVLFSAAVMDNIHRGIHQSASLAWGSESGINALPLPLRRLPSFALRGRRAPVEIWCLPATGRVRV
jgi:class 3 adenylate cyclase